MLPNICNIYNIFDILFFIYHSCNAKCTQLTGPSNVHAVNARVGVEWEQPLLTKYPNGYATHTASDSKVLTLPSRGGTVLTNRERRKARY